MHLSDRHQQEQLRNCDDNSRTGHAWHPFRWLHKKITPPRYPETIKIVSSANVLQGGLTQQLLVCPSKPYREASRLLTAKACAARSHGQNGAQWRGPSRPG